MKLKWTKALSCGIKEIDNQHRKMIKTIERLTTAMSKGRGTDEIESTVKFLENYVVERFITEELLMESHAYPQTGFHKTQHTLFLNSLAKFRKEFRIEGASPALAANLQSELGRWLVNHIMKVDKDMGVYLQKQK